MGLGQKGTGSLIPDPDPQHCFSIVAPDSTGGTLFSTPTIFTKRRRPSDNEVRQKRRLFHALSEMVSHWDSVKKIASQSINYCTSLELVLNLLLVSIRQSF
jgi:hypothetical protein